MVADSFPHVLWSQWIPNTISALKLQILWHFHVLDGLQPIRSLLYSFFSSMIWAQTIFLINFVWVVDSYHHTYSSTHFFRLSIHLLVWCMRALHFQISLTIPRIAPLLTEDLYRLPHCVFFRLWGFSIIDHSQSRGLLSSFWPERPQIQAPLFCIDDS